MLRLVLALVLVLFAMRQAANPELYRIFFSEPQNYSISIKRLPAKQGFEAGTSTEKDLGELDGNEGSNGYAAAKNGSGGPAGLEKTVQVLTDEDRDLLSRLLWRKRLQTDRPPSAEAAATASDAGDDAARLASVLMSAASLAGELFGGTEGDSPLEDARERERLQAALDMHFLKSVSEGSLWHKRDVLAFNRLLADGTDGTVYLGPGVSPVGRRVGVVTLLQQPKAYLNTRVVIGGQLARLSERNAEPNPYDLQKYWELWLQPDDGSERPVVFYTAAIPPGLAAYAGNTYIADGPSMVLEGVFIKRLAFQSAEGSQLAPVIVGGMYIGDESLVDGSSEAGAGGSRKAELPFSWMVAAAFVIGSLIVVVIWSVSTASAKRTRAVRAAAQALPDQHFQALASNVADSDLKETEK
jgi:hypothetical protein